MSNNKTKVTDPLLPDQEFIVRDLPTTADTELKIGVYRQLSPGGMKILACACRDEETARHIADLLTDQ